MVVVVVVGLILRRDGIKCERRTRPDTRHKMHLECAVEEEEEATDAMEEGLWEKICGGSAEEEAN